MEGLWYAHFKAGPVQGDGMAVLRQGEILGGDPLHTYSGSYQSDGSLLYANVRVSPYTAGPAPTDIERPIDFFLQGSIEGKTANIAGHADNKPELAVTVELHRAA
ncbi:MAG TPA: GrlR family regulatory protein [Terracidiphilus sp.]|nr:GrlR family regulatory protein [Terracidiphilus sp.]